MTDRSNERPADARKGDRPAQVEPDVVTASETTPENIPVMRPQLPRAETLLPYLRRIDASRIYSNYGPLVQEFENRLSRHFELPAGGAVSASTGTTALIGAVLATAGRARPDRPLGLFREYWQNPDENAARFRGDWYLTGDVARRDTDGYFWFVGRADDVIKTSGHLIGPFEVESILMEHPAVAEAGVIGKPDPVAMEVVKAFVSLKAGFEPSEALRRELLAFARTRLGAVVAPKEIAFDPNLPKTRSGKIMRRLLKARELGLPEGDISTLEGATDADR